MNDGVLGGIPGSPQGDQGQAGPLECHVSEGLVGGLVMCLTIGLADKALPLEWNGGSKGVSGTRSKS